MLVILKPENIQGVLLKIRARGMQDEASPHFSGGVCQYLHASYGNRWMDAVNLRYGHLNNRILTLSTISCGVD